MTTRRGFLGAMLAVCAAPAIVRSGVLMPVREIVVPSSEPWVPPELKSIGDLMEAANDMLGQTTMFAPGAGLLVGDVITIAGIGGAFRIASKETAGVISLARF